MRANKLKSELDSVGGHETCCPASLFLKKKKRAEKRKKKDIFFRVSLKNEIYNLGIHKAGV